MPDEKKRAEIIARNLSKEFIQRIQSAVIIHDIKHDYAAQLLLELVVQDLQRHV